MSEKLSIEVLEQTYTVQCPKQAIEKLKLSLNKLNSLCQKIQTKEGKSIDREKLLVVAGLNLASQVITIKEQQRTYDSKVQQLSDKIDLLK